MNAIFVYGILKGRSGAKPARVVGYRLADMGSYPAAIPDPQGVIIGELIEVADETLKEFDRIEGHPDFYIRRDVIVETGEDDDSLKLHQAQFYVITEPYHDHASYKTEALEIKNFGTKIAYEYNC